jgi:hypothetical protein
VVSFAHVFVSIIYAAGAFEKGYVGPLGEGATVTPARIPQTGIRVLGSVMDCPQRLVAHLLSIPPTLDSFMSRSVKTTVWNEGNQLTSEKILS